MYYCPAIKYQVWSSCPRHPNTRSAAQHGKLGVDHLPRLILRRVCCMFRSSYIYTPEYYIHAAVQGINQYCLRIYSLSDHHKMFNHRGVRSIIHPCSEEPSSLFANFFSLEQVSTPALMNTSSHSLTSEGSAKKRNFAPLAVVHHYNYAPSGYNITSKLAPLLTLMTSIPKSKPR